MRINVCSTKHISDLNLLEGCVNSWLFMYIYLYKLKWKKIYSIHPFCFGGAHSKKSLHIWYIKTGIHIWNNKINVENGTTIIRYVFFCITENGWQVTWNRLLFCIHPMKIVLWQTLLLSAHIALLHLWVSFFIQ